MKITNLECPSCGGKLKPLSGNSHIMICDYCNNQFMLEDDVTVNYHIHQAPAGQTPRQSSEPSSKGPAAIGIIAAVIFLSLIILSSSISSQQNRSSYTTPSFTAADWEYEDSWEDYDYDEEIGTEHSPFYTTMTEAIFEKESGRITEEDLNRIKYLKVSTSLDFYTVEYSFQSPYGKEGTSFETVTLQLSPSLWDCHDLASFPGLEKVDISDGQGEKAPLGALTELKGLICRDLAPDEITQKLADPSQLLELSLDSPGTLDGIASFENLERLTVEDISSPDLKQLVALKNLKFLSLEEEDDSDPFSDEAPSSLTDYSALSVLTGLEGLELSSPFIRDFSFLKPMTGLTSLTLTESEAISIAPLAELSNLTYLKLEDNNTLQDYSPVASLTNLHTLVIDKSTSQADPDLSPLQQLEDLDMCGFISISFLNRMSSLKHLSIHSCNLDEVSALSGLTGLETLTCYSVWTYAVPLRDVNFIDNMPNLKSLDFSGATSDNSWGGFQYYTQILGDISNVFNHPSLETLILNNCMFNIEFNKITENPALKHLELKEVELKENFYVEAYNGMIDIWYDDLSLDDHINFLSNYPNLEVLYLDGNQLTNIQFASALHKLTTFSIKDNYVTDLSPLHQAENLEYLDIRTNPINSTIENDGSILILK
ncbi:internalin-A [Lachnospiraceae bacterium]|nr:internalin-A [Lachnospiraceae bacterium]